MDSGQSAKTRFSFLQMAVLAVLLLGISGLLMAFPQRARLMAEAFALLALGGYSAMRVMSAGLGMIYQNKIHIPLSELNELRDDDLPVYSILLPVYREAKVLRQLIESIQRMDYPPEKLDAILLVEETDHETRLELERWTVPEFMQVLLIPDGVPKTKPRACNVGLGKARGELLVIYDAEDRPEPDQLKKAVCAFRRSEPDTVCLQAQLNCYNSNQNLLTRLFTLEYSVWFDFYLPGIYKMGGPIPLGGTSNHLRTDVLRRIGGWDSFNVTEDCDLGMRIKRCSLQTAILDSTTWEEAPSRLRDWFFQRTRWCKGYVQTTFVHTRGFGDPGNSFSIYQMLLFLFIVPLHVISLILSPLALVGWMLISWKALKLPQMAVALAVVGGLVALGTILIHLLAARNRRFKGFGRWALLTPLYYLMASFPAFRAIAQFFSNPHRWEKTPHGFWISETVSRPVLRWSLRRPW